MATYVLVHGGWAGGWQWKPVATLLRATGHEVFTPTLTGLGERVHLATPAIDLTTHIEDILNVLRFEELSNVILVGYSYSGLVISGVAERADDKIAHLVYLDGYVPEDGQSLADMVGPDVMAFMQQAADQFGDGWTIPHYPPDAPRRTPMPIRPAYQSLALTNQKAAALPKTFIYCSEGKDAMGPIAIPITQAAQRAKIRPGWQYHELKTEHIPMETKPNELTNLLLDIDRD